MAFSKYVELVSEDKQEFPKLQEYTSFGAAG